MSNEIQVIHHNQPLATVPQPVFTHPGDSGVQIANQQGATVNIFLPSSTGSLFNAATTISTEYYNLFVVGDDVFTETSVLVQKDRALTTSEGVAPDISARFAPLTPEAIAEIKMLPSIFATENRQYGKTYADHNAVFGFVTDVRKQENGIKVYFQKLCVIPQQRLNEMAFALAIQGSSSFNELNRMHWTIKRIHLVEELRTAGISVLLPT
jgi:hypothetical protein